MRITLQDKGKRSKEVSENNRFQEGFEKGLPIVRASLEKKSGSRTEEKMYERVGRLKAKYPSVIGR